MNVDILQTIRGFTIDMDGVLFRGKTPLPGAHTFIRRLQQEGTPFVLLTNNSTLTLAQYVDKLNHLGFEVSDEHILTSAVATGLYLADRARPGTRMYVVGMDGLEEALVDQGFIVTDDSPEYVVVGLDRGVTYEKLSKASLAIRAGAVFVASNPDRTIPSERGIEPGVGSILAAIEAATGVAPVVVGKPQRAAFEAALKRLGLKPHETAMIGDRLETDIAGGIDVGMRTILVLTGVTSQADLAGSEIQPDLVFDNLEYLLSTWSSSTSAPQAPIHTTTSSHSNA